MKNINTAKYVYFLVVAFKFFSLSLTASYGTIYILSRDISYPWLGYLGTISSLTIIIFEFPTGIVADRYGHSISVFFALILNGIGALLTTQCYGPFYFSIITIISSIGFTLYSGAAETWAFNKDKTIKKNIAHFYANSSINLFAYITITI